MSLFWWVLNVTLRPGKIREKKPGKGTPQEIVGAGKGLKLRDNHGSLILYKGTMIPMILNKWPNPTHPL